MKRLLTIILFFSFVIIQLPGQQFSSESPKAQKFYKNGKDYFTARNYPKAIENLQKAIKEDPKFQAAYMVLAEVYWEQERFQLAADAYNDGLSIDPTFYPRGYLNKAKLEIYTGNYEKAVKSYQTFLGLGVDNQKLTETAEFGLKCANYAIYAISHPVDFNPVNLGDNVNSKDDEYWPTLSADEQKLIITRKIGSGDNLTHQQEDFLYSTETGTEWTKMKGVGKPLNTPFNEGAQTISADGKTMVYTVCTRKGIGRCDLFISHFKNGEWTVPVSIGPPVNTADKETQPSLSADGRTLYYACDRKDGKGGMDIWKSTLNDDGGWSAPENLGDSVNNDGNQIAPFIHHDNKSLYFASDKHIGIGGFDIYKASFNEDGNCTGIDNLGYPINTQHDEFGLIVNAKGNMAYYSLETEGENGRDIYRFEIPLPARPNEVSYLKGSVFDAKSYKPLSANFELSNLETGSLISKSISDEKGEFLVCIPTDNNYMLSVKAEGYLFYSDNFSLKGVFHIEEPYKKKIPLNPIIAGERIILKNIFFATDSYQLEKESELELNELVSFLNNNPTLKVELSGHTDNQGSDAYNLELSDNRANSVVDYLVSKGIDKERLVAKGYGLTEPIANNETSEGRAQNRRTELKILE